VVLPAFNLYLTLQTISLVINSSLLVYIYNKLLKLEQGRVFFLIMLCMTIWLVGDVMTSSAVNADQALAWDRLSFVGASIVGPGLVWFVIEAAYPRLIFRKTILYLLTVVAVFILVISIKTDLVCLSTVRTNWGYYAYPGVLYTPVSSYISGLGLISIL
jgi:hypothetical protein